MAKTDWYFFMVMTHRDSGNFNESEVNAFYEKILNEYLNNLSVKSLRHNYMDILELIDKYIGLLIENKQSDSNEIKTLFIKLRLIFRNPIFLSDLGCVELFKVLTTIKGHLLPISFNMFTQWDGEKYLLRDGFDERQIATFSALIDCDEIWQNPEMQRQLFASIAEALGKMDCHEKTLDARIKLLEKNLAHKKHAELDFKLVYSFTTDEDKMALKKVMGEKQGTPIAQMANEILTGYYDKMAWAI